MKGKMLVLNPKDRPTITEILNKPIIKRKVISYISELLGKNNADTQTPGDDVI